MSIRRVDFLDRVLHNMRESVRWLRARDVGRGLRQRRLQRLRSWRSASHVSSYCYIYFLILLFMCPHTTIYVSSYFYVWSLQLLASVWLIWLFAFRCASSYHPYTCLLLLNMPTDEKYGYYKICLDMHTCIHSDGRAHTAMCVCVCVLVCPL